MRYTRKLACHLPVPILLDWRHGFVFLARWDSGSAATLFVLP